jgi:RimJ/RimL family protein N-acetyltransferase
MELRRPLPSDVDALVEFFARIPAAERTFFKEAVLDRAAVESWPTGGGRRALACEEHRIAGYCAVIPLTGWSDHVGEVRLVVDPERRGQGYGRALARWALLQGVELGLSKVYVEVVADQEGAVGMFTALGFQAEGLLRDHVRDRDGQLRDLILLAHPVDDQWAAMATAGIDDALR